jgi:DNA adenine methylase
MTTPDHNTRFVGSKGNSGLKQRIISLMPPHQVYLEPFLGRGIILNTKLPADLNIGADVDPAAPGLTMGSVHPGTILILADAISLITSLAPLMSPAWQLYIDPPYLASTLANPNRTYYVHNFATEQQHEQLLSLLLTLPAHIIISSYDNPLYRSLLTSWSHTSITTVTRGGRRRQEFLWFNYPPPTTFHDTRFLGDNYRERERIKRKRARWLNRLQQMHPIDRAALLSAIQDLH